MTTAKDVTNIKVVGNVAGVIASSVFAIRWLLAPFYVGLVVAILAYLYKFGQQIYDLVLNIRAMEEKDLLLNVLNQIDETMIANLVVIIALGGYYIFVDKTAFDRITNKPAWMNGITSTSLKTKMCMSLVGVTAVHLLSTFEKIAPGTPWTPILQGLLIHVTFIVTTVVFAYVDIISHPPGAHAPAVNADPGTPVVITTTPEPHPHH